MLVLSRRESERIKLGNSIVLTVIRVSGDRVRLEIEAPPDVLVLREELQRNSPSTACRRLQRIKANLSVVQRFGCHARACRAHVFPRIAAIATLARPRHRLH